MAHRAQVLRAIREYFYEASVLEVVTPLLQPYGSSEVHLDSLKLEPGYLQTSPEYAMKKLLAENRQSIYQICSAFRGGETGQKHRVEFQMLEWYRIDYSLEALMQDLEALLEAVLAAVSSTLANQSPGAGINLPLNRAAYKSLFREQFGVCPHTASEKELLQLCRNLPVEHLGSDPRRADMLDALFSMSVEPSLSDAILVYDFPACQVALAELKQDEEMNQVADRFELYLDGIEIANAYQELTDTAELKRRFEENNKIRRGTGRPEVPDDPELPRAIEKMSRCSGAALGIDRLLMALSGATDIESV